MVALSSTKAKCMAMGHAIQEGLYLQMLQLEMGIEPEGGGTLLLLDNQSAVKPLVKPSSSEALTHRVLGTTKM